MTNSEKSHGQLEDLLDSISEELKCSPSDVTHELSELLAGVDRDVVRLRQSRARTKGEYESLSSQLFQLSTQFKSKLPRLSKIAQELMEHLTRMGL